MRNRSSLIGALALAALLSACSSSSKTSTAASTTSTGAGATTTASSSTTAGPTTTQSQASAIAALAKVGPATAGPGITVSKVSTADGQVAHQVTYYGHLLYYFKGDTAPGQTSGLSIPDFYLLGPFGNVMLPHA